MPARIKAPPSNPFRFGRIVSGDAFTDREADLLVLERELRGGQNILIEAPRRFGKTSLILEVKRRLQAAGIPVAYLDCMLVPSRARLADRLASAYLDAFRSPAQRAEDWVVQHLKTFRVRPTLTIDDHGTLSFPSKRVAPARPISSPCWSRSSRNPKRLRELANESGSS